MITLNGSSSMSCGNGASISITVNRTEPWLLQALAGLGSRWPWHGGR